MKCRGLMWGLAGFAIAIASRVAFDVLWQRLRARQPGQVAPLLPWPVRRREPPTPVQPA